MKLHDEEKESFTMSKLVEANEKIAEKVVDGYKKIENGVVKAYKKIEIVTVHGLGYKAVIK